MPEYINKTEQALLDRLDELKLELENCKDPEERVEIQKIIDENFLTLGMFYKTYLYGKPKIVPGFRYFKCEFCSYEWRDACRDSESPSQDSCIACGDYAEPYKSEPHPEWPVDNHGNLIDEDNLTYEKIN